MGLRKPYSKPEINILLKLFNLSKLSCNKKGIEDETRLPNLS